MTPDIAALETYQAAFKAQMKRLLDDLNAGRIGYGVWRARVETELRALHLFAAQLAVGGVDALTPADRDRLALLTDRQLAYFHAFAAQEMPPSPTHISPARLNLYAGYGRALFFLFYAQSLGLPELPAYPADGSTLCGTNDLCLWTFNKVDGGWDCFWVLRADEHCPTCLRRAVAWNPLQIRDGVVLPYEATGLFR